MHSALDNNISDPTPGKTASVTTVELLPEQVYHNGHHQSYTTADREQSVTALDLQATHLISSPYSDFTNQLDLQRLGLQDRLFALALTSLAPLRPDYATAPYMSTFNWPIVFAHLRALCAQFGLSWERQEFYLVIFRSQLSRGIDRTRLGELDKESHREACESGGLLKYWFGSCDGEMRNLATCESFDGWLATFPTDLAVQASGAIEQMLRQAAEGRGTSKRGRQPERCTRVSRFIRTSW